MSAFWNTVIDSVPIVGDLKEMYETITGIRENGIGKTLMRGALGFVPNGPWTSVAEGAARFTGGKGWEQTVTDWVMGDNKEEEKHPDEVGLSTDRRKEVAEMSRETAVAMQKGGDIEEIVAEKIKELEKIENPQERAEAIYAYSELSQINIQTIAEEFGNISKEQYEAMEAAKAELKGAVEDAGIGAVESGIQRIDGKDKSIA